MKGEGSRKYEQFLDTEIEDRIAVEEFFYSLHNLNIKNHENRNIKTVLKRPGHRITEPDYHDDDQFLFEFEGYPGYDTAFSPHDKKANYFWLSVDYDKRKITSEFSLLNHPDLKSFGKKPGVNANFFREFGKNFPEGFRFYAAVVNKRMNEELNNIRAKVVSGQDSIYEGEEALKNNFWIQERMAAGFNVNEVYFVSGGVPPIIISKKTSDKKPVLKADFNLFDNVKNVPE